MKHNYEENKQRRKDAAKDRIARNEKEADNHFQTADKIASFIPPGQPILIGHHSEKRHRRDLDKIRASMSKGHTALEKAEYYRERVNAMESSIVISSDDPQAIEKLTEKLQKLTEIQEFMKAANKCIKKKDKEKFLLLEYGTEVLWDELLTPDCCRRIGYPAYKLTNNNARIRCIGQRIEALKHVASLVTTEKTVKGVRVVQNVEANRIQLFFPSKPAEEVREKLHRQHSFNWCRQEGAWQRFLNPQSIYEADVFLNQYNPDI